MDLSIETKIDTVGTNLRWLGGSHGIDDGVTGTLNVASVIAYKNTVGVLPSGIALAYNEATKLYDLFDGAATDGHEVLAGYLLSDEPVVNSSGAALVKIGISVLTHGAIRAANLPVVAQRATVKAADTTGLFTYRV